MRLIGLAVILTVSLALAPLVSERQQQAEKVYRVGWMSTGPHPFIEPFRKGLTTLINDGDEMRTRREGLIEQRDRVARADHPNYTSGMEHSPTSATGTGWERMPWHATQRAAWEVLRRTTGDGAST